MKRYRVVITDEAKADLLRLQEFALDRELASETPDLDVVDRMLEAVEESLRILAFSPYTCRRAARASDHSRRELVIPFGHSGLIAAFRVCADSVFVGAVRHQLEEDFRH